MQIIVIAETLDKSNDHFWSVSCDELLASQFNLVVEATILLGEDIVLSSTHPPECAGEGSNHDSRECGKGAPVVIRGFDDLPEKGKRDVIGGALFCVRIFILAAIFAVHRDKKRSRHDHNK